MAPQLSADEFGAVAEQLGADGATWRGVLRCVSRSARDGVDGAASASRVMDPWLLARRVGLLAWAAGQGCSLVDDRRTRWAAVEHGGLEVLRWGAEHLDWVRIFQYEETCCLAARGGQLATLQWLGGQGCYDSSDGRICAAAAEGGHINVLQWAREQGTPWGDTQTNACEEAASEGHLATLQWAREHGCPWDEWICYMAACNGHLDVIQWAKANGAPWDPEGHCDYGNWDTFCSVAAECGHLAMLQWLCEQGCHCD